MDLSQNADQYEYKWSRRNSSIVIAHEEMKIKQSNAKEYVARILKKGQISKSQATAELKKAYTTVAHQLDLEQRAIEYETDLTGGQEDPRDRLQ